MESRRSARRGRRGTFGPGPSCFHRDVFVPSERVRAKLLPCRADATTDARPVSIADLRSAIAAEASGPTHLWSARVDRWRVLRREIATCDDASYAEARTWALEERARLSASVRPFLAFVPRRGALTDDLPRNGRREFATTTREFASGAIPLAAYHDPMPLRRSLLTLLLVVLTSCGSSPRVEPDGGAAIADAGQSDTGAGPGPGTDAGSELDAGSDRPAVDGGTSGCGRTVAAGRVSIETEVAGVRRTYAVVVPDSDDARRPLPVVFVFHGLGGDGSQVRSYMSLESVAGAEALHVFPDGLPTAAAGGRTAWSPSDVGFVDAMLAELGAAYCVDEARVFAMGHSYGAYMTNLVGCERGNVIRGIAPVSGGIVGGSCRGAVPAWIAHGTSDSTVPASEGSAARDAWLRTNACETSSAPVEPTPCVAYDCPAGAEVVWCPFEGGHFPLPAFTRGAIWSFFEAL